MSKFCIILSAKNNLQPVSRTKGVYYASLQESTFKKYDGNSLVTDAAMPNCILQKVSYHKKMYEANTLDIEILAVIGATDVDTAITSYEKVFKGATIDVIENKKPADKDQEMLETMTGYRICAVVPKEDTSANVNANRSITIILKAFSPDKALDITPYCETFHGQTFGEILSSKLGANGIFSYFKDKYAYAPTDNLKYENKDKENNEDEKFKEYKQPYLVQYNESFYQFLVRVANRCGQYVCYEHGKLDIGAIDKFQNYSKKKDASNYMGAAVIERDVDYSFADSLVESKFFASNYCDSSVKEATDISENNEIVDNSQSAYIKMSDNYTARENVITHGIETLNILSTVAQADSLVNAVVKPSEKDIEMGIVLKRIDGDLKDDFKNEKSPAYEHNKTLPIKSGDQEPKEKDTDAPSVTGPMTSEWYEEIAKSQRNAEKKKLTITYKTHPNVFLLGDTLEDKYTVTEISGEWSYVKKTSSTGDIVHEDTIVSFNHVVTAIGKEGTPYLGEKRIRRATPHKAVVAQVNDPLRIGRVRVKFPWDKSQTLSPWIRISSPAAYKDGGFLFTPAVKDEAMVDFEDGNIERPFVIGFMHTRENKPYIGSRSYNKKAAMYKTLGEGDKANDPMSCVITNRTGQSITLENGKNSRGFFKGMFPGGGIHVFRGKDFFGNKDTNLGGSITLTDAYGVCTIKSNTGGRCITIDSALGKVELSAFTGITVSCPNGDIKLKGKNITLEAGNNISIKSGGNKGGLGYQETSKSITSSLTQGAMSLVDNSLFLYDNGALSIKGIFDMSYMRAMLEVLLRPLEGTTTIRTPGYIMLSTGKGGEISGYAADAADKFDRIQWAGWAGKPVEKTRKTKEYHTCLKTKKTYGRVLEGMLEGLVDTILTDTGVGSVSDFFSNSIETLVNSRNMIAGGGPSGLIISTEQGHYKPLHSKDDEHNVENEGEEILLAEGDDNEDIDNHGDEILVQNNVNQQENINNAENVHDDGHINAENASRLVGLMRERFQVNEAPRIREDGNSFSAYS